MVFPSVPLYLDPPNWQQQQNPQQGSSNNDNSLQLPLPSVAAGGGTTIRPTSMADRARLAKIQQPEATLKCPRCESTNTKFCYFNNYSLSQPRHFCKTCRRYWTRGGALRNVPVGGGCRRNKRSKGTSSKSPISADMNIGSASSSSATTSRSCTANIISPTFIGSMHHLSDYNMPDLGLNFTGMPQTVNDFSLSGNSTILSGIASTKYQWKFPQVQQFPFVTGLEPTPPISPSLYPFSSDNVDASFTESSELLRNKSDSFVTQLCPVKMESSQGFDLSKQVLGSQGNEQYWGNSWTDLPEFSSSSTAHLL